MTSLAIRARRTGRRIGPRVALLAVVALALPLAALSLPSASAASGPYTIDGTVPDSGLTAILDPSGNVKELGPINSNSTKIGVIHNAAVPMLGYTNPNAQVDLNTVWLDLKRVGTGSTAKDWLYFAWQRDSNSGSGFIAYEFMQNDAPTACAYDTATPSALIGGCNPWANRSAGDFMILWDQQGGSRALTLRTWSGTAPNLTLSAGTTLDSTVSEAQYSADGYRGEAAVNLTDTVGNGTATCVTIANTVPSTVTGNSDSADYKDTVLTTKRLSSCGSLSVTKTSSDNVSQSGAVFTLYTGANTGGTTVDTCTVNSSGACIWTSNSSSTLSNVQAGQYTLDETTVPSGYTKPNSLPDTFSVSTGLVTKSYIDQANPATLSISKVDDAGGPVSGAVFSLYSGSSVIGTAVNSCTTNSAGVCLWPGSATSLTNLVAGTYTLDETTVPTGYSKVTTGTYALPYTFTATNGQTISLPFTDNRLFKVITIVCKQAGPALYPSAITVNGTSAGNSLASAGLPAGVTAGDLCGITAGSRSGLGTGTPSVSVTIN